MTMAVVASPSAGRLVLQVRLSDPNSEQGILGQPESTVQRASLSSGAHLGPWVVALSLDPDPSDKMG